MAKSQDWTQFETILDETQTADAMSVHTAMTFVAQATPTVDPIAAFQQALADALPSVLTTATPTPDRTLELLREELELLRNQAAAAQYSPPVSMWTLMWMLFSDFWGTMYALFNALVFSGHYWNLIAFLLPLIVTLVACALFKLDKNLYIVILCMVLANPFAIFIALPVLLMKEFYWWMSVGYKTVPAYKERVVELTGEVNFKFVPEVMLYESPIKQFVYKWFWFAVPRAVLPVIQAPPVEVDEAQLAGRQQLAANINAARVQPWIRQPHGPPRGAQVPPPVRPGLGFQFPQAPVEMVAEALQKDSPIFPANWKESVTMIELDLALANGETKTWAGQLARIGPHYVATNHTFFRGEIPEQDFWNSSFGEIWIQTRVRQRDGNVKNFVARIVALKRDYVVLDFGKKDPQIPTRKPGRWQIGDPVVLYAMDENGQIDESFGRIVSDTVHTCSSKHGWSGGLLCNEHGAIGIHQGALGGQNHWISYHGEVPHPQPKTRVEEPLEEFTEVVGEAHKRFKAPKQGRIVQRHDISGPQASDDFQLYGQDDEDDYDQYLEDERSEWMEWKQSGRQGNEPDYPMSRKEWAAVRGVDGESTTKSPAVVAQPNKKKPQDNELAPGEAFTPREIALIKLMSKGVTYGSFDQKRVARLIGDTIHIAQAHEGEDPEKILVEVLTHAPTTVEGWNNWFATKFGQPLTNSEKQFITEAKMTQVPDVVSEVFRSRVANFTEPPNGGGTSLPVTADKKGAQASPQQKQASVNQVALESIATTQSSSKPASTQGSNSQNKDSQTSSARRRMRKRSSSVSTPAAKQETQTPSSASVSKTIA